MPRIILAVLVSVLALTLASCSSLTVRSDWDEQADFTTFQTYKILPIQSPAHKLIENRIMDSVRVHLNERGYVILKDTFAETLVRELRRAAE